MNSVTKSARPTAPKASGLVVAQARSPEALAAERWIVRLHLAAPVFGKESHDWAFVCDGQMAEELASAVMEQRRVRLAFPGNTVILDAAQVVLCDFQPHTGQ